MMKNLIKELGNSKFICKLQFILLFIVVYPVFEEGRNIAPLFIGVILGVFIAFVVLLLDVRGTNGQGRIQ
jgi:hypothetical protein